MVHLDFLFETKSLIDNSKYDQLKKDYDILSRKINKFIQWVEANLNEFTKQPDNQ